MSNFFTEAPFQFLFFYCFGFFLIMICGRVYPPDVFNLPFKSENGLDLEIKNIYHIEISVFMSCANIFKCH